MAKIRADEGRKKLREAKRKGGKNESRLEYLMKKQTWGGGGGGRPTDRWDRAEKEVPVNTCRGDSRKAGNEASEQKERRKHWDRQVGRKDQLGRKVGR